LTACVKSKTAEELLIDLISADSFVITNVSSVSTTSIIIDGESYYLKITGTIDQTIEAYYIDGDSGGDFLYTKNILSQIVDPSKTDQWIKIDAALIDELSIFDAYQALIQGESKGRMLFYDVARNIATNMYMEGDKHVLKEGSIDQITSLEMWADGTDLCIAAIVDGVSVKVTASDINKTKINLPNAARDAVDVDELINFPE
jgi:hypothetical protein